jgi:tetratricopeptide (TPR) repeat protein
MKTTKIWPLLCLFFTISAYSLLHSAQAGRGTARIGGVVIDETGNPIASAKIVVHFQGKEEISREAKSDQKGKWAILGLGSGYWRVAASAEGYVPAQTDVNVSQVNINPAITLTLKKAVPSESKIIENESTLTLLDKASQLFNEGKYTEAIDVCQEFLVKNPQAYQAHLNIGDCYREMGELDKAFAEYTLVQEQSQQDELTGKKMKAKALSSIGDIYLIKGDLEKAQDCFRQSIEASPEDEILPYNVGEIYFSNQKIDEAIYYFELSIKIRPDWSDPYLKLGYVFLNKGDKEKAVENFQKFLKLEPDSERSQIVRGILETLQK